MTVITDKVPVKNGADYTFVCSRIPFAVSCSSILPHGDHNLIDMDLVLKMKIPLQRIKVERFSINGETVRTVGVISQTIQCVRHGRISGNIHLQAKVVRNLYDMFDVDCIASAKTYERLVGRKPPPAPDDPMDIDEDDEDRVEADKDEDNKDTTDDDEEDDDPAEADKDKDDKPSVEADKEEDDDDGYKYVECNWDDFIDRTPYDEASLYPGEPKVFGDSDDEDYETTVIKISDRNYATVKVPRSTTVPSPLMTSKPTPTNPSAPGTKSKEYFCKYCFLSGQPISVTYGHNIMDVTCPSMTDEDKERIHGPNWLPKMYGYND